MLQLGLLVAAKQCSSLGTMEPKFALQKLIQVLDGENLALECAKRDWRICWYHYSYGPKYQL